MQLTLVYTFITELKAQLKCCKDNLKACQLNFAESKKLATFREERGKPEASISVDIELVLEKYNVSCAAYYGGDFNGISCRRLVGEIVQKIQKVLEMKKNETCNNATINNKVQQLEHTLGLLDAAF